MLGSGEMQTWVRISRGWEGSNWRSCSRKWRERGHKYPGFPKSCAHCGVPIAKFIPRSCYWHVKTTTLRAVNWADKSCLPSVAAFVEGFAFLLWGVNVSSPGLCCCTGTAVWCWPGLGCILWSVALWCPCSSGIHSLCCSPGLEKSSLLSFTDAW